MVSARTALLVVLRDAPGYGRDLARRILVATRGRERFAEGSLYPALRALAAAGLVRTWSVVPGRRRGGRARTYYELTARGVRVAEAERRSLLELAAGPAPPAPDSAERDRMRRRIELGVEISEAGLELAGSEPRRPRRRSA